MTERFPVGDHEPAQLSPEQERIQQAGMTYMRYLCGRLEGELYPPEGFYRTALRNDITPEYMLIAVGGDRSLKIHTAPDEDGRSREFTYSTVYGELGYAGTLQDTVYAQSGSPMEGSNLPEPLNQRDLDFLDGFLARKLPIPEVIDAVRKQVQQIMNPAPTNE